MPDDATIDRYGPVALVTGASSGIGRAFAEELAARGLDLVLVARRVDRLDELAAALAEQHGTHATVCRADLSEVDAVATIARATDALDVGLVVSNAGFGLKGPYEGHAGQRLTDMLMVNCNAPMRLAHHFVPRLRRRGRGGILFTSSVEGLMGMPYSAAYAATKALVNSLAEGLWGELSPEGIDVLALCPGATDTEAPRLQGIDPATLTDVMSPTEVAKRALENLRNGPVHVCSEPYKARFEQLTALPRRDALMAAAKALKRS